MDWFWQREIRRRIKDSDRIMDNDKKMRDESLIKKFVA